MLKSRVGREFLACMQEVALFFWTIVHSSPMQHHSFRTGTDPRIGEGLEILLVGPGDRVLFPAFHPERISSRRQ
jgi:hypothetical protein